VGHADVIIREDGAVEDLVRNELDVRNLRETWDEVGDPVPLADAR